MPYTLGINQTCFCELSFKDTVSLRVYIWQSENDFSEKDGAESAITLALASLNMGTGLFETVLTSPAISLSLALLYLFPLRLSIETHPPMSALVQLSFNVTEQSDFHEKPVVRYATQQSVVMDCLLKTFQLRVGTVKNPSGNVGKCIPSILFNTYIPLLVLRMYPFLKPSKVPFDLKLFYPNFVQISTSLFKYLSRMESVLTRLPSQFCQNTRMLVVFFKALKVTVSVCMLEETSVKQRSLLPESNEMDLTSLTIAN